MKTKALPEHRNSVRMMTTKMRRKMNRMIIHSLTFPKMTSFSSFFIRHTALAWKRKTERWVEYWKSIDTHFVFINRYVTNVSWVTRKGNMEFSVMWLMTTVFREWNGWETMLSHGRRKVTLPLFQVEQEIPQNRSENKKSPYLLRIVCTPIIPLISCRVVGGH